jgi:hypothetical protein
VIFDFERNERYPEAALVQHPLSRCPSAGQIIDRMAAGFHACAVQHECDYLVSKLF